MRNLKKILALVLALVMVVGMMSIASAATAGTNFVDDSSIVNYDEAVQVLEALGIYKGQGGGNFAPNTTITRAEVAALVYRIVTGDVNDLQKNLYSDYGKFKDVNAASWYAGYVNYCANGKYIMGDNTNFYPDLAVNGYQVLAIMLRVLGYGKNGEFEGTGWEIRTATMAKELGITDTINAGTLGAAATRAMVAELLFRSIAKVSMVNYTLLNGYQPTYQTLGWVQFDLFGGSTTGSVTPSAAYDATDLAAMTDRKAAEADAKYGEPEAKWYVGSTSVAITVEFNVKKTYTTGVADDVLYADSGVVTLAGQVSANVVVDGGTDATKTLYKLATAATASTDTYGGKGALTELYVADGLVFVVVRNTYVDTVYTAYALNANGTIKDNFRTTNIGAASFDSVDSTILSARLAALKVNDVVVFNKYNGTVDATTVELAKVEDVTVTKTYDTGDNATSYFLAGKKYEYNCKFAGNHLADDILDRDAMGGKFRQYVYTDKYGYVVYTADWTAAANATGYMVVTDGTYGGMVAHNQFVLNFSGYSSNGTPMTIRGGMDTAYYTTATAASSAQFYVTPGVYKYEIDALTGMYKLTTTDRLTATDAIAAGDADALASAANGVLNDTTVFVIANYDAAGIVTGYEVVTGFKNIKNLANGSIVTSASVPVPYAVQYVNVVEVVDNTATVDFVFVTGASKTAQLSSSSYVTLDDGIFLLDNVSQSVVSTHDTHTVVKNGAVGTIDVVVNDVEGATETFYAIAGTVGGYYDIGSAEPTANLRYYAPGVLRNATAGTWVTMASNCVAYLIDTTASTCTALTAAQLATLNASAGYNGFIAATDAFGYATVVYFVA